MFVRHLKHKNGKTYIQIVDKSSGHNRVIKSFGAAATPEELQTLRNQANSWLKAQSGLVELDFEDEVVRYTQISDNITSH